MIVDGVWATIGSTNFDNRSFALNEELNVAVYDRKIARQLEQIFAADLKRSRKVSYEEWDARGRNFLSSLLFPSRSNCEGRGSPQPIGDNLHGS